MDEQTNPMSDALIPLLDKSTPMTDAATPLLTDADLFQSIEQRLASLMIDIGWISSNSQVTQQDAENLIEEVELLKGVIDLAEMRSASQGRPYKARLETLIQRILEIDVDDKPREIALLIDKIQLHLDKGAIRRLYSLCCI